MQKSWRSLALVSLFVSPGVFGAQTAVQLAASAAPTKFVYAERLSLAGLPKLGKVSDSLYRGGQPQADGLRQLKSLGVTTIIDLRGEDQRTADWERKQAESLGMRFIHIPVSGWSTPTDAQLAQFLGYFRGNSTEKVFVHCRLGQDRTGVFVAAYRIAFEHWSSEQTLGEMRDFGFNRWLHPNMMSYVRTFPDHLRAAPMLVSALGPVSVK